MSTRMALKHMMKGELQRMRFNALKLFLYKLGLSSAKPHPEFRLTKRPGPKR